ncbi:stalk domain-containing protein [Peptoniphilus grossensis]|uniref:Stalk domain-containing protein n=1 Tax=Peptoniphilus grossensis TaxID=1465756 RepID=A0ABU7XAJ3_9FIRM
MNKRILSLFLAIVMVFGVVSPAFAAGFTPQNHLQKAAESELIADNGKLKAKLSLPKTEKREARPMMQVLVNRSRKTPLRTGAEPGFGETKVTVNIAKHGIGSNEFAFDKVFGSGAKKTITLYDDADEAATPEQTVTFTSGDNVVEFTTPIPMQHVKAGDVYIEFEGTHVAGKLTWEESDPSYSGGTNVTTYKLDLYQVRNTDVIVKTVDAEGTEVANPKTGKIKLGSLGKEIAIPVKGTTGVFTGKNIRVKDVDKLNDDPNYSVERLESGVLVDKDANKVYKPTIGTPDPDGLKPTEITFTEKPIVTETEPKIDDPENPGTQITDPDYVKVTFAKGDHGTIATNKTYYVFKGVEMKAALSAPEVKPEEGYKFTSWNPDLTTKYEENTTHKAEYTKDTCLTPPALKEQFENAANEKFASVGSKDGVYIGHFDEAKKEVTVYIIDKTQVAKEISGTGLAAGLADLYENHNLVKVKVGDQDERDLIDIANKLQAGGMNIMQTFKTIFGADILNAVQTEGNKTGTLADFIDKSVVLKLTIEQAGCGNAVTVEYKVNGKEAASSLLKDKLDPQDISVWVGDEFKWKDGIKLKEADEDLQAILDKATVTDLGENGTEKDPKTPRTSAAKGKFPGNLLVTFEDGSKLVVENQNLYVYANGDEKPEDGKPVPTDAATVTFTKDDNSIKADGWDTVKPIIVKKGTKVPAEKFPSLEGKAAEGYENPGWYKDAETTATADPSTVEITADTTFTAKATAQTTNDDVIPWVPGTDDEPTTGSDDKPIPTDYIVVTFTAQKESGTALGTVTVGAKTGEVVKAKVKPNTDLSTKTDITATGNNGYGFTKWNPVLGKVTDTNNAFEAQFIKDGSEVGKNDPIPEGWHRVTVKQDATIAAGTVTEKTYAVKDKLSKDKLIDLTGKAADKYENPAWYDGNTNLGVKPTQDVAVSADKTIIAKATLKPVYTDDVVVPWIPGTDDEPTKGSDGKDIPADYITVTFKSEDINKGKVKVGTKEGLEVKAKVKPGTNLEGKAQAVAEDGYGFTVWDPALGVAADKAEYTAKFIKSGDEVGKTDPIPTGWFRVTVKQDTTSIQAGTVTEKYYGVKANDKLAADKFPSLDGKEAEGYENPAWYKDAETKATADPSTVEITADTTFTAKATNIAPPVNKSEKPKINQPTVGDDKITGTGVPGATIVVKDGNGHEIGTGTVKDDGTWEVTVPPAEPLVSGEKITATQTETGKSESEPVTATVKDKTTPPTPEGPSVTYPDTDIDKGDTKTITPDIKDKDGNPTTPKDIPDVVQPGNGVIVTPHKDGSIDVTVPEDYDGPGTITVDVTVRVDGKDINTTLTIRVNSGDDNDRPEHDGGDIFDGLFKRHDYTPTYPVKTVVPEKTKEINKLWYIFHIDEYDYEEVRNYNSTSHKMDVTPVIRNERTMLPLRYVAEAINADVIWNAETRTATFTKDGLTASIQIDSDEIVLSNGKTVKMDSKPLNINDRILVSVVNVANVFGMTNGHTLDGTDQDIEWNQNDKSATIYVRR